jgi:hypothetical protein
MSDIERLQRQLYALTEIAKTLTLPLELPELLDAVIQKIIGVIEPAEVGAVMLWDQPSGLFRPAAAFGYDTQALSELGLRAGEAITGKVFDEGVGCLLSTPERVAEAMADMRPSNRAVMTRALGSDALPRCTLAAPIQVVSYKYGVLVLETIQGPSVIYSLWQSIVTAWLLRLMKYAKNAGLNGCAQRFWQPYRMSCVCL